MRHDTSPCISPQQERFVEEYVRNGGNGKAAAVAAGYAEGSSASGLIGNHKVREAIELKRDTEIKTTGASQAWIVMQSLLTDPSAPAQVRFQAARWTLEASGHGLSAVAAALHLGKSGKKDLYEMSASELAEVVERGRQQLESMRHVVQEMKSVENAIDLKPDDDTK